MIIKKYKVKVQQVGQKNLAKALTEGTASPEEIADQTFAVKVAIEADFEAAREITVHLNEYLKKLATGK